MPHPDSLSRTTIALSGGTAEVEVSFQSLSLIEVLDGLDTNEDLELSLEEIEESRERIESYLVERLRFVLPSRGGKPGAVAAGRLVSLDFLPEAVARVRALGNV